MDADFFFVNVTEEEADTMLSEIRHLFEELYESTYFRGRFFEGILESRRVTTCIVSGQVYQFVHRIYPSAMHVIGGFDLGPGMMYFDGESIWTHPFGAFSVAHALIIGDLSRRSPSYEARIAKYVRTKECRLLMCNTTPRKIVQTVVEQLNGISLVGSVDIRINLAFNMDLLVNVRRARQYVRNGGTTEHTVDEVLRLADPVAACKSDYGLVSHRIVDGDIEAHNLRVAARCHYDLITWKYNSGKVETSDHLPEAVHHFGWRIEDSGIPLKCLRSLWPALDVSIRERAKHSLYAETILFSPKEAAKLWSLLSVTATKVDEFLQSDERCVRWMIDNPGRQWTSSFNPIPSTRNWYSPRFQNPLVTGVSDEVYCLLRCAQLKGYGPFGSGQFMFPRDVLKIILSWVYRLMAEEGLRICRLSND